MWCEKPVASGFPTPEAKKICRLMRALPTYDFRETRLQFVPTTLYQPQRLIMIVSKALFAWKLQTENVIWKKSINRARKEEVKMRYPI